MVLNAKNNYYFVLNILKCQLTIYINYHASHDMQLLLVDGLSALRIECASNAHRSRAHCNGKTTLDRTRIEPIHFLEVD